MVFVGAYIKSVSLDAVFEQLLCLPDGYRPTHFGSSERKPARSNLINSPKFQEFAARNQQGYFLFAGKCRYDITAVFLSGYGTVYVEPFDGGFEDDGATLLFNCLFGESCFIFSCQIPEYHHRNRVCVKTEKHSLEAWVGRDLGKYMPGIYWMTGVGAEVVNRLGLADLAGLLSGSGARLDDQGRLRVKMGACSADWKQWADQVGGLCRKHPGVFSADQVLVQITPSMDYATLSGVLGQWR
jgi:hypothetical protein